MIKILCLLSLFSGSINAFADGIVAKCTAQNSSDGSSTKYEVMTGFLSYKASSDGHLNTFGWSTRLQPQCEKAPFISTVDCGYSLYTVIEEKSGTTSAQTIQLPAGFKGSISFKVSGSDSDISVTCSASQTSE